MGRRATAPGGWRYKLLPTGAGESRPLGIRVVAEVGAVQWFPDGEHLLITGSASAKGKVRDYRADLLAGEPLPVALRAGTQ